MDSLTKPILALVAVLSAAFAVFHFMDERHDPTGTAQAVQSEARAQATTLLMTIKNLQRGRLASYNEVPEEELTELEKRQRLILEYDLRNIEAIEQAAGLEVPDGE